LGKIWKYQGKFKRVPTQNTTVSENASTN